MTISRRTFIKGTAGAALACALPLRADEPAASDFTEPGLFTGGIEGPACDAAGNVYAVNFQRQGAIGIVTPDGNASLFVELPEGSIGNGIRFSRAGDMFIADYKQHNVLKVDMTTRDVTVFAHEDAMHQPNDLAICDDDTLFASDPDWANTAGQVWRIDPDGSVSRFATDMGTANGIEVSPDQRVLYVAESRQRRIVRIALNARHDAGARDELIAFPDHGLDGMRCDIDGNLYVTRHGKGSVAVVSPQGRLLREIATTGTKPSNLAFGGPDGRQVYVTLADRGCIETFRADRPGRAWAMRSQVAP
jgi:sugar lactone lactonase YvrE